MHLGRQCERQLADDSDSMKATAELCLLHDLLPMPCIAITMTLWTFARTTGGVWVANVSAIAITMATTVSVMTQNAPRPTTKYETCPCEMGDNTYNFPLEEETQNL